MEASSWDQAATSATEYDNRHAVSQCSGDPEQQQPVPRQQGVRPVASTTAISHDADTRQERAERNPHDQVVSDTEAPDPRGHRHPGS